MRYISVGIAEVVTPSDQNNSKAAPPMKTNMGAPSIADIIRIMIPVKTEPEGASGNIIDRIITQGRLRAMRSFDQMLFLEKQTIKRRAISPKPIGIISSAIH